MLFKYKLSEQQQYSKIMGSTITIDKHTSSLDDWLSIQNKLDAIEFTAHPTTHLALWKVFTDDLDHLVNTVPLPLDFRNLDQLFSADEAYVGALTIKNNYQPLSEASQEIFAALTTITDNIEVNSYKVCIRSGKISCFLHPQDEILFYTYAFFGKRAHNRIRSSALGYAYKLGSFLNNEKRIKVLSGGGVFRNKKLQMGSLVPLSKQSTQDLKIDISQFSHLHLVSQLIPSNSSKGPESLSIFNYHPKMKIPIVDCLSNGTSEQQEKPHFNEGQRAVPKLKAIPPKTNTGVKPPLLKLSLKPYEQMTYEEMKEQQKHNKFQIRDTARHELKMQKFSKDCSKIIEGLYLSGEKVAKNEQILEENGITEIVNCAGDYCENWFQKVKDPANNASPKYNYLTFFLKDSQNENIECLFYRVIDFINAAHRNKKNVLVHCIQGISRSVTFVIAYLIFMNGFDYKKAESFVKQRRGIACPNNGFMVELIQFHKRLYEDYHSLPSPRVFLVSFHCKETPEIITARMIKHSLFEKKKYLGMDSRGMYIIQAEDTVYLWVGNKCEDEKRMKKYWAYAQEYIRRLQEHQKAPMKIKAISEGKEGRDFLSLWNLEQMPENYQNDDYNRLFEIQSVPPKPGYIRKYYEREQDQIEQSFQSKLYVYPDTENGLAVFDLDDLSGFCILVKSDSDCVKVFVWKDSNWVSNVELEGEYLDQIIEQNYSSYDAENIQISEESFQVFQMSEEFINCFS